MYLRQMLHISVHLPTQSAVLVNKYFVFKDPCIFCSFVGKTKITLDWISEGHPAPNNGQNKGHTGLFWLLSLINSFYKG